MEEYMEKERLQWHPAFFAGMQIELKDEADNLIFENEYQLGTKPLGIDILIIKKDINIPIHKNIGRIFRKYNIVEYKGPTDYFSINDFYKVYAYASLYKANTDYEDEIKTSEMTITFVSSHYPRKLEKYLAEKRHYHFEKSDDGIYQIIGNEFAMQFIVTSQISKEENLWIWSMNNSINDVRITEKLLNEYRENKNNKHYESVMDIIINANPKTFMEDRKMCKALEEILKNQIQEAIAQTKIEDILECLKKRGEMPKKLQERISNEKELEVLKHWYSTALDVNSIEEFQNAM